MKSEEKSVLKIKNSDNIVMPYAETLSYTFGCQWANSVAGTDDRRVGEVLNIAR